MALGILLVLSLGILALFRLAGDSEPADTVENVTVTPIQRPKSDQMMVYVVGEVNRPGVYSIPPGSRVVDAIKAAGGLTEKANQFGVNLAAKLRDEQMVKVYAVGETPTETPTPDATDLPPEDYPPSEDPPPPPPDDPGPGGDLTPPPPAGHYQGGEIPPPADLTPPPPPVAPATPGADPGAKTPSAPPPPPVGKVSLNRGTVEQLEAIPGVGPKLAAAIVAYRRGPPPRAFTTLEDVTRVPGIKGPKLDEIRAFITL